MLESQIWLITEFVFRLDFFYQNHVLDSDAELAVFVVAWFVGEDVSCCERDFGELDACADADGAFVHVEVGADAVACAVAVVEAFFLRWSLVLLEKEKV